MIHVNRAIGWSVAPGSDDGRHEPGGDGIKAAWPTGAGFSGNPDVTLRSRRRVTMPGAGSDGERSDPARHRLLPDVVSEPDHCCLGISLHCLISLSPTSLLTRVRWGRPTRKPTPRLPLTYFTSPGLRSSVTELFDSVLAQISTSPGSRIDVRRYQLRWASSIDQAQPRDRRCRFENTVHTPQSWPVLQYPAPPDPVDLTNAMRRRPV